MKKDILLILDLDETLIHATPNELMVEYDFKVFKYFVYKRPFLDEFLTMCAENFKLAIWSSASDDYVVEIVNQIIPKEITLEFVWGRKRCTPIVISPTDENGYYNLDGYSYYEYTKQLKKIRKRGYDLKKVLIVDDTPSKVYNSYGNAIYLNEYKGGKEDMELKILADYLLTFQGMENVRIIEKRYWQKNYKN